MKKTILALIAVLVLGIVAYYSFQDKNETSTLKVEETDFSVTDTSIITRFFIARKNGNNYQFVKNNEEEWVVNKSWKAQKFAVNMILGTISEMKVKAPVPKGMRNEVIKTLASQGVKVELYSNNGLIKTFYVGDYTADEKGTFFIMEGSENPYIVHIPRFNGYLTGRFQIKKDEFLDRRIFGSRKDDIALLSVDYQVEGLNNFKINQNGIHGVNTIDSLKLNQYLAYYQKIYAEAYFKNVNKKQQIFADSMVQTTPFATIKLVDKNDKKSNEVVLFDIKNKDRFFAYLPKQEQYAWVQHYVFDKLLVDKSYFEKKELNF